MRFHTVLRGAGKTATGIHVPDEIVAALGSSKKPAVRVTINGHTYRSTVAHMGGDFMVGVSAENREAAGVKSGDELDVEIELDSEPRVLALPPDFAAALAAEPGARAFFESLSYSKKQRFVLPIEGAKAPETRRRRIDGAISLLREGRI